MTKKAITVSDVNKVENKWFDNEVKAIEFMQTMKNESTYFEDETQIYVEKEGVGYELIKGEN